MQDIQKQYPFLAESFTNPPTGTQYLTGVKDNVEYTLSYSPDKFSYILTRDGGYLVATQNNEPGPIIDALDKISAGQNVQPNALAQLMTELFHVPR